MGLLACTPAVAQSSSDQQIRTTIAPGITARELATIREAPYSKIFSSTDANGNPTYGIKDRDYEPSQSKMGIFTLWADVADSGFLGVLVRYCVPNRTIAKDKAYLAEIELRDRGQTLLTLKDNQAATAAAVEEVEPAQRIIYSDPFYDPYFYSYGYYGNRRRAFLPPPVVASYIPAVKCSLGGNRFDLSELKEQVRSLPHETLQMRLLFSNGIVENWNLGGKTIAEIKRLPSMTGVSQ